MEKAVRKIFFGNYKGGVGKTTTVFEIGALLAKNHEKRVLLIDLDPQCSLSKICCKKGNINATELNIEETLNFTVELYAEYVKEASRIEILEGNIKTNSSTIRGAIKNISEFSKDGGKLDFIPTVLDMKNARLNDISDRLSKNPISALAIPKILSDIIGEDKNNYNYDYILFDCPPTSNIITQSVFLACDYYFIPTISDEISSDGVADYISEIESTYLKFAYNNEIGGLLVKKYFHGKPTLIGVLETINKGRKGSEEISPIIKALDEAITALGIKSIVKGTEYAAPNTKHIFNTRIKHFDNRSDPKNLGIPITLYNGGIHEAYYDITNIIANII